MFSISKPIVMRSGFLVLLAGFVLVPSGQAAWWERLGFKSASPAPTAALSSEQMAQGLKEALGAGVERAVQQLGREGGFLNNPSVKIPVPESLRTAEKTARALGQSQLADDFIAAMNRAAEQAVPEAVGVFRDALKQMTIPDARAILAGSDDAATQFFRRTSETNLYTRFHPLVQRATDQVGVTARYKQLTSKVGAASALSGWLGGGTQAAPAALDLDDYVTHRALDGLFKMMADEEKRIRENPAARTTALLRQVFGTSPP